MGDMEQNRVDRHREDREYASLARTSPPVAGEAADEAVIAGDFEGHLERHLERLPRSVVPEEFAARVAQLAVGQRVPVRSRWDGFGLRAAVASGVALTVALFACAPHTSPSFLDLRFDLEMILLTELGGVAYLVARLRLQE